MWRAFFLAIGVCLLILGGEFMLVDRVVLHHAPKAGSAIGTMAILTDTEVGDGKTYSPPDWTPWSLFSAGAVVVIYSCTIPKRVKD
jgi:hypothetical protein